MKLYIETSVPNFLVSEQDSIEKQKITEQFFKEKIAGHEVFISDLVLKEIENAPETKRDKLKNIITKYKLQALKLTKEANNLAEEYLKEGIKIFN